MIILCGVNENTLKSPRFPQNFPFGYFEPKACAESSISTILFSLHHASISVPFPVLPLSGTKITAFNFGVSISFHMTWLSLYLHQ